MAEEQTSIDEGKDYLQGKPTRESFCQNLEHLGRRRRRGQEGSTVSARCTSVEVAEEDPRSWRGPHGEVNVLRLEDRGVGGPISSVADVRQFGSDGVGSGGSTLAEVVRCPGEARGREAQR